jgi:iron(III) transport system ATP-binding protein
MTAAGLASAQPGGGADAPGSAEQAGRLRLDGLTKVFRTRGADPVVAVDKVTLDVAPGEFITLLGPSGCGKTTTLRIVAGLEEATGGHVRLDGQPSYALFPHLTVEQNIAYGLRVQRRGKEETETAIRIALTSMNLVGLENRSPHELSGGQQQRVALARALVVQPKVLLFDEPLSNLDAKLRGAMRAEIRRIQRRLGITSLYVTHDQDEAMTMSDRIVVMNKGRIEQVATPADIYFRPATVFVADFIGRANFIEVVPEQVDEGGATVTALGRTMTVPAHPDVRPNAGAYLMVRPETLSLAPAPMGGVGTVLRATFHGHSVDYEVETNAGTLAVTVPGPDPRTLLDEGANVSVAIDPARAYVLTKS